MSGSETVRGSPARAEGEDEAQSMEPRLTSAVVDVFVYVVVLNLFVEYLPSVLSETFTLSLLTAVLLKAVLEVVVPVKNWIKRRIKQASTPRGKLAAALLLWVLLVASKFAVLEAVDLVFGSRVSLGGFLSVTLVVITLLLSRAAFVACSGVAKYRPRVSRTTWPRRRAASPGAHMARPHGGPIRPSPELRAREPSCDGPGYRTAGVLRR